MNMHPAQFGAAVQNWKHLAGVQEMVGIEGAFDPLLMGQIIVIEHGPHEIAFLDADAMFPCQYAANFDTQGQNFSAEFFRRLKLARDIRIVKD